MTGTICYATASGLGIEAKAFIDNGVIDKILVWPHSTYSDEGWHKDKRVDMEGLLKCDRLIFFETVFDWQIIPLARERGIKTILVSHYECTPSPLPYWPDIIVAPSDIDLEYYPAAKRINIPVEAEWKLRKKARVFIHNSGHGGLGGRNGTKELLEAMKLVKSPLKLIVRSQNGGLKSDDPRVEIVNGSVPYDELWKDGDVLVFPEKFGGSFLPMQEAFASGLPVMASDRFPTNSWLPNELLIPVAGLTKERIGAEFESAVLSPKLIAEHLDAWYDQDISRFSKMGKEWAKENSWAKLKPRYDEL